MKYKSQFIIASIFAFALTGCTASYTDSDTALDTEHSDQAIPEPSDDGASNDNNSDEIADGDTPVSNQHISVTLDLDELDTGEGNIQCTTGMTGGKHTYSFEGESLNLLSTMIQKHI